MNRPAASLLLVLATVLTGCGPSWVPVEDRSGGESSYAITSDGHYRVRRGDTLHAIAFNYGLDWRDVAEWNGIRAPYTIYPDQEIRLSPPTSPARSDGEVVTRPASRPAGAVSRDAAPDPAASTAATRPEIASEPPAPGGSASRTAERVADSPVPQSPAAPASEPPAAAASAQSSPARAVPLTDPERWLWPAEGRLLSSFLANDPARNGIDIAGQEGQPVRAAAAGEVVYSGSGLIGYGELIIVKHSDRMLSAYAHNRRRLVSEGQRVAAGEQLAEMGRNDRNQAMLHFEIRVNGTPQDPMKYLPRR
jgi:lipoprotein NlpD